MTKKKGSLKRLMTAPYGVWMALFVLIPIALIVYFAFTDGTGSFTFDNVKKIPEFGSTFALSIWLAVISTMICLLLAYPLAYNVSKMKMSRQQIVIMLVMLPMWMNFLIRTYAWMTILEKNGLINNFLGLLGFENGLQMINTNGAIVLGMVYNYLPFMILPIYSVLVKIDPKTIEAAQDLGANRLTVFRRVILPLSLPGVISGITMVFVPSVSTFIISKLLGGGKTNLIGDVIDMYFLGSAGEVNYNIGAALSLVLMVLILICMGVMNHFDDDETAGGGMML